MPALIPLLLTDRETTPVDWTFNPRSSQDDVAYLVSSDGVPIGDRTITFSTRNTGTKYKSRVVMKVPVVVNETINGVNVPKVARTAYADLTLTFDATSTEQERSNIVGMLAHALSPGKTLVNDVIVGLEGVY